MKDLEKSARLAIQSEEEELYAVFGYAVSQGEMGAAPSDPNKLTQRGKEWFAAQTERLQLSVCGSDDLQKKMSAVSSDDEVGLVLAIADLIVGLCGGIPAVYVSALILKIGLSKFCNDYNSRP